MGAIDDLFIILRTENAPMVEGFLQAGAAEEQFAAKTAATMAEVTASIDRMALNARLAGGSIDEMSLAATADYERMAAKTAKLSAGMEAQTVKAARANENIDKAWATTAGKTGMAASTVIGGSLAVAGAMAYIGWQATKMAGDYESATNRLVTSAGEQRSNLDMVRQGMLRMAGEVGDSADALATAMYTVESGGYHGAAGLQVLRAAAEGAKAENADLKEVADATTTALTDYHMGADKAALVTSKLVAATSQGKTTFQELTGSLHSVLPAASAAHISLDDILGDVAAMTVHGMSAAQATQNLSDVIRHMQNPTATQAKELALLGMTTNQLADDLRSKGLSGTLQEISGRILNMAPPGTEHVILQLKTALSSLPPAVQDLGQKLIDGSVSMKQYVLESRNLDPISAKQAASFATLAGSTHRIGDQQMTAAQVAQNYSQALAKATGDATGLNTALMLTGNNAPIVNGAVKAISGTTAEAGNHVKGWHDIQATFNQKMDQAKAAFHSVAIELGQQLLPSLTKVVGKFADGVVWISKHHSALKVLAVGMVATFAPLLILIGLVSSLGFGFLWLASHVGTALHAISRAAVSVWHWLVDVWHAIARETSKIWRDDIVEPVKGAWRSVANFFKGAWHAVADPVERAWHKVESVTKTVWNGITGFFRKWWPLLLVVFAPGIALVMAVWNHFHKNIESVAHKAWDRIKVFFRDVWTGIKTLAVGIWHGIYDSVVRPVEDTWHRLVNIWHTVETFLGFVWGKVEGRATDLWQRIKDAIWTPIADAVRKVTEEAERIWHTLEDKFNAAYNSVRSMLGRFGDLGRDLVMGIVHGVENAGHFLLDKLQSVAEGALSGAKRFLGISSPSKVFADEVGHWIPHGIAAGIARSAGVAQSALDGVLAGLTGTPQLAFTAGMSYGGGSYAGGAQVASSATPRTVRPVPSGAGAAAAPVMLNQTIHVHVGERELRDVVIQDARRNKLRNGHTLLT